MKNKAIVIGASMSGLLAARVLSDFFREVVIVERDSLAYEYEHRRGVPQSRHAHGLLAGGSDVLENFFPGITQELADAGAVRADVVNDGRWFFEGACLRRTPSTTIGILLSRPLLESTVRGRVRKIGNVAIMDGRSVRHLVNTGGRVMGVRTDDETLRANLVVDASGRGSQSLKWLEAMRFPLPREEKVEINVAYTTRLFRRRETDMNGDLFGVVPATPGKPQSGVLLAQENGLWIAGLMARFGIQPPEDIDGFLDFAKNLEAPFIYDTIRTAKPVGVAMTMRFPSSIRRRFEELHQTPHGFLVFGDAICSFNPVYGQGMTVAAMQAKALGDQLSSDAENLSAAFYKAAAKAIDTPWALAVGSDLKMPETKGNRTLAGKLLGWYVARLHKFAHTDADAAATFLRVAQLLEDPSALLRPRLAIRVLAANIFGAYGIPRTTGDREAEAQPN